MNPTPSQASEITLPAVPGGDYAFANQVMGELVFTTPDRQVDQFSFWLVDPGAGASDLHFQLGIAAVNSIGRANSVLFESDWQTLHAGAGGVHRVGAETGGLLLDPDTDYFFYVLTGSYAGPSWQIQTTLNNYGPGGRGGHVSYPRWLETLNNDISEMPNDRDFHFDATFYDPTSVPEPSTMLLMGLGALAVIARRRTRNPS